MPALGVMEAFDFCHVKPIRIFVLFPVYKLRVCIFMFDILCAVIWSTRIIEIGLLFIITTIYKNITIYNYISNCY